MRPTTRVGYVMTTRLVIHPTQDQLYQRCPRQFKLSVVDGLRPREPVTGLAVGSLGHAALEAYYRKGECPAAAFENAYHEWAKELEDPDLLTDEIHQQAESLYTVLGAYPEYAREQDRWAVWYIEQPFEVPIYTDGEFEVLLCGRFDLVVHAEGRIWIVDHKFYSRFPSPRLLHIDTQFTSYALAARLLWPDEQFGGVIPNIIRKNPPKTKQTQWFYRDWVAKTDTQLINHREHLLRRLSRVVEDLKEDRWTPQTGLHCASCQFYSLCRAMDDGSNVEALIEASYTRTEPADFGFVEEEVAV